MFLTGLTSKCASRHNGVHFFDIWMASNRPKVVRACVFCTFSLPNVLRATTACTFSTSQLPKVARILSVCVLCTLFTSKCASRHNGVHFFDISTSKSVRDPHVFCHFLLWNVLRATTACTFSTSQLPQVFRAWGVPDTFRLPNVLRATTACTFSFLIWPAGSAPAALASLLFDPPEPQNIGKHSVSRLSYLFAHLHLLSSDFLHLLSSPFYTSPSLIVSSSDFLSRVIFLAVQILSHLRILSEV